MIKFLPIKLKRNIICKQAERGGENPPGSGAGQNRRTEKTRPRFGSWYKHSELDSYISLNLESMIRNYQGILSVNSLNRFFTLILLSDQNILKIISNAFNKSK